VNPEKTKGIPPVAAETTAVKAKIDDTWTLLILILIESARMIKENAMRRSPSSA